MIGGKLYNMAVDCNKWYFKRDTTPAESACSSRLSTKQVKSLQQTIRNFISLKRNSTWDDERNSQYLEAKLSEEPLVLSRLVSTT